MLEGYRSQRFPNLRTELLINCSPQASNLWHQGFCWPLKRSLCYKKLYVIYICSYMFIYNIVWYSIPTFNYSTTFLQFIPWYLSSKTPPKVEISSNVLRFTTICKKTYRMKTSHTFLPRSSREASFKSVAARVFKLSVPLSQTSWSSKTWDLVRYSIQDVLL